MFPWVARRLEIGAAGAVLCSAIALWASFGALSFVDADNTAAYVGVLPPASLLAFLLAAAAIGVAVIRPPARSVAPLWLSAAAILPWLPLPFPLSVFIWTGNVLVWLWAAIVIALLAPAIGHVRLAVVSPRKSALIAGLAAAAIYGLITWSVAAAHPNGDEPHYLVIKASSGITTSGSRTTTRVLITRLSGPDHQSDFIKRGLNGQIYSIHAPGLLLLVALDLRFSVIPESSSSWCCSAPQPARFSGLRYGASPATRPPAGSAGPRHCSRCRSRSMPRRSSLTVSAR